MKKMNKMVCIMLSGIMLASTMSGCTTGTKETTAAFETKEGDTRKESVSETPATEEPVTLRFAWWGNDARHEKTIKLIYMYHDKHPNVTIEPEYRG